MARFSVYCDVPDYLTNGTTNVETASLVGGNTTLTAPAPVGSIALQVAGTTGFPAAPATFEAWLLDGANSERVRASVTDATHLAVASGTAYAHASTVSVSSAGTGGCLASVIAQASGIIEGICRQGPDGGDRSLYAQLRTEVLRGPSQRAAIDTDRTVLLRPYHFPVASVSTLALQIGAQPAASLSLSYLVLPDGARSIAVPWAQIAANPPAGALYLGRPLPRHYGFYATLTYTGGPCTDGTLASVPYDLRQACFLVVTDLLGLRANPTGAMQTRRGDVMTMFQMRGEKGGNSLLMQQALYRLQPYMLSPGM